MNIWANQAMRSSAPLIRPMWMQNPQSSIAHTITDQFFVGDKVIYHYYSIIDEVYIFNNNVYFYLQCYYLYFKIDIGYTYT